MKQIIFDEFKRQWIIWSGYFLLCFVVGLMAVFVEDNHIWIVLFAPVWLTSFLNQFDRRPGHLRVVLALPFTTRQIGRVFWWLRAGIPTLFLAFFGGLGILLHGTFANQQAMAFEAWLRMVLLGGLLFGSLFWLFSGAPPPSPNAGQNRFWGRLYSYGFSIALIGGGYLLYKSTVSLEMKFAIICFFGLTFSILGWFRAEGLVVDCGAYRERLADSNKPRGILKPQTGYGGIPFLIINFCVRCLATGVLITAFFVGLSVWSDHRFNWADILDSLSTAEIYIFFLCFGLLAPIGSQLKFLRSLPLSSKQLAATILSMAILPFLIFSGTYTSLFMAETGGPSGQSIFKLYLLGLAPLCVMTTAIVWHDEKRFERIVLLVIMLIISAIPLIYQLISGVGDNSKHDLPLWIIITVPLTSIFLALLTITHLLEKNDMTYRIRPENSNGLLGPNW